MPYHERNAILNRLYGAIYLSRSYFVQVFAGLSIEHDILLNPDNVDEHFEQQI